MWKVTLPYLRQALIRSKAALGVVVVGAFVAGTFATVKSLIESRIITAVADVLNGSEGGSIWSRPLGAVGSDDSDWVASFANGMFNGLDFRSGIAIYIAISLVGVGLAIATTSSRESISRRLFSNLFEAGVQKAFAKSSARVEMDDEPGGLAGAVQQGAQAVSGAYVLLVEAAQYLFSLATIFVVLARVQLGFAVLCVVLTTLLAGISALQGHLLNDRRTQYDDRRRGLFGFTGDVLANRDVLLAQERRSHYVKRLRDSSHELGTIDKDLSTRESVYIGSVNFIYDLGLIAILGVVLFAASRGADVKSVGDAYFYVALFGRIMSPIRSILSGYDSVRRSMSTSRTLLSLLERTDEGAASAAVSPKADGREYHEVDFCDVSFAYSPAKPVLNHCSFGVPKGGVTLIVGRSGAGKTTIARMLLGFLTPDEGQIAVRGKPMTDWQHEKLLCEMSYLAQTGHVLDGTVRENLFVSETASLDLLTAALQTVRLADTPVDAIDLLDSPATKLSEGQKQRLALARIFVDQAPIVVLDEPLAGVDAFTFAEVSQPMSDWMADPSRTVVLVSHRLEFVPAATHVVVLGRDRAVVEEGSPEDLRANPNGVFASLLNAGRTELATEAADR